MADLPMAIPRKDSLWRCPCGYEEHMPKMSGHRVAWRKHPGCQDGKIVMIDPGSPESPPLFRNSGLLPYSPKPEPIAPAPIESEAPVMTIPDATQAQGEDTRSVPVETPEGSHPYEFVDRDIFTDPEAVAKLYNERRFKVAPVSGEPPPDGGGNGHAVEPLEPGDFRVERSLQPAISFIREPVNLPVIVKVMYDWARDQGWNVGDGSMSTFVTDMLMDHFRNCMGMMVGVGRREDFRGS